MKLKTSRSVLEHFVVFFFALNHLASFLELLMGLGFRVSLMHGALEYS
jgi:hypothetical protein